MSRMVGPSGTGSVKSYQRVCLFGAEVGAVEDLLQADDLRAGVGGLLDIGDVLVDHGLFGDLERGIGRRGVGGLNQRTADDARHADLPR